MFCIFFIIYNVLVFFTAISNVKEVLWELHKRDEMRASLHGLDETTRPEGDGGESTFATTQSPTSVVLLRKLSGRLFSAPASTPPSPQRGDDQQLDASAFIVQALVATGKLDQKRDVDPILRVMFDIFYSILRRPLSFPLLFRCALLLFFNLHKIWESLESIFTDY
jgi:hypothetical protein